MKKEVASSSTTPSSVSVAAASDGEQPPLLVPVPAGAEAFEYERGKKDIFPKPGELVQVRRSASCRPSSPRLITSALIPTRARFR